MTGDQGNAPYNPTQLFLEGDTGRLALRMYSWCDYYNDHTLNDRVRLWARKQGDSKDEIDAAWALLQRKGLV